MVLRQGLAASPRAHTGSRNSGSCRHVKTRVQHSNAAEAPRQDRRRRSVLGTPGCRRPSCFLYSWVLTRHQMMMLAVRLPNPDPDPPP